MRVCYDDSDASSAMSSNTLLSGMKVPELKAWLKARGVRGLSKMNRTTLLEVASKHENAALTGAALYTATVSAASSSFGASTNGRKSKAKGAVTTAAVTAAAVPAPETTPAKKRARKNDTVQRTSTVTTIDAASYAHGYGYGRGDVDGYAALRVWYTAHVLNASSSLDNMDKIGLHIVKTTEALLEAERSQPTATGWRAQPLTRLPQTQRARYNFDYFARRSSTNGDRAAREPLYRVLPQTIANLWSWPAFLLAETRHSAKLLELVASVVIYEKTSKKRKRPSDGGDEKGLASTTSTHPSMLDGLAHLYPDLRDYEMRKALAQTVPQLFPGLRNIIWRYWNSNASRIDAGLSATKAATLV